MLFSHRACIVFIQAQTGNNAKKTQLKLWEKIMQNVTTELKGNILIIQVDISKEFGRSASGKTITIASTKGNKQVEGVVVGLNVYKYPESK